MEELDALVGTQLIGEAPRVQWVDTATEFQFDSVEEAVESVRDPFFRQLSELNGMANTVLKEVREFRRYSSELTLAILHRPRGETYGRSYN